MFCQYIVILKQYIFCYNDVGGSMIKKFNTETEFYEIKDINKNYIHFIYDIDYKRDDRIKETLLERMLLNYTNDLRTAQEFGTKYDELYMLDYNIQVYSNKDRALLKVSFAIPKIDLIDDFSCEEAIKFMHDILYNPYIENDKFNEEAFNAEIDYLKQREVDFPHSIGEFVSSTFLDFFDEEHKNIIHHDDYLNYLNNVDSKEVYDYYLKNIKNNKFKIWVFGNDKEILTNSLDKYFKQEKTSFELELYQHSFMPILEYKEKEIDIDYNQSVINLLYQFKDIKSEDDEIFYMLYFFLNARENDLLYNNLRNKYHLIYDSIVRNNFNYGIIGVMIFLDYADVPKALDIVNQTFDEIRVESNFNLYKERLLKAIEYDMLDKLDYPVNNMHDIIDKEYKIESSLTEKVNFIKNTSYNDFMKFLDRMVLTNKMIMKSGDMND